MAVSKMQITSARLDLKGDKGNRIYQYLATITGCLSVISTGMVFGWPSPSLPILEGKDSPIPMTSSDGSWMAVMPSVGAATGAFLAAYIVDKLGRKTCILLTAPIYFVAWMVIAFAASIPVLIMARFLQGTADGIAYTVFPMYLGEISSSEIRGLLGSSLPVTTTLGILLVNIVGAYLDIKTTALVIASVPVLHLVTFWFMPESPYYLLMKNKKDAARKSLQTLNGIEDVSIELDRLSGAVKEDMQNAGKIWDLFTIVSNRKALWIIVGLRAFQQLSGTSAITFYATKIFGDSGSEISSNLAAIIYFAVQLVVSGVFSVIVDKSGRRPLLILSIIGTASALFVEGIYFYIEKRTNADLSSVSIIPLVALWAYVVVFNVGLGTIPVLMLGEVFPTSVKAFALCLADVSFAIIVAIIAKLFQILNDEFGMYVPFLTFAVCCVFGLFFIIFFVPETKGKTLEQIQCELKGEVPDQNPIS